jgi:hypothetical protein
LNTCQRAHKEWGSDWKCEGYTFALRERVRKRMKAGGLGILCWKRSAQVAENKGAEFASVAGDWEEASRGCGGRCAARTGSFVQEMVS